jgi:hypothetical protein
MSNRHIIAMPHLSSISAPSVGVTRPNLETDTEIRGFLVFTCNTL